MYKYTASGELIKNNLLEGYENDSDPIKGGSVLTYVPSKKDDSDPIKGGSVLTYVPSKKDIILTSKKDDSDPIKEDDLDDLKKEQVVIADPVDKEEKI